MIRINTPRLTAIEVDEVKSYGKIYSSLFSLLILFSIYSIDVYNNSNALNMYLRWQDVVFFSKFNISED